MIKKLKELKHGMSDIVSMVRDRNFQPFLRPLLILIVIMIAAWFLHKGTSKQISDMRKKAEAQAAEADNREEFLRNKSKYAKLIEELPSNTQKSLWHASQLISIKERLELPNGALSNGNEVQTTEGVFTISSIPVKGDLTFEQLGRVLEAIENNPVFLRVSDLKVNRKPGELEKLSVTFNTNTVFVQDKDFPSFIGGKK
ncbi:MAG: hypothetical protein J5594_02000 [Elusimicrobiaceae bacterium]|nr:hypothetical protein [Elusimicrobiaceae bacterium]